MRPHLSVLMLLARSTIYKVLGLLLALALVEGALFHLALVSNGSGDSGFVSLERAFAQSRIPIVFGVCFLVMTILTERTGHAPGSKQEYTLWRLSALSGASSHGRPFTILPATSCSGRRSCLSPSLSADCIY